MDHYSALPSTTTTTDEPLNLCKSDLEANQKRVSLVKHFADLLFHQIETAKCKVHHGESAYELLNEVYRKMTSQLLQLYRYTGDRYCIPDEYTLAAVPPLAHEANRRPFGRPDWSGSKLVSSFNFVPRNHEPPIPKHDQIEPQIQLDPPPPMLYPMINSEAAPPPMSISLSPPVLSPIHSNFSNCELVKPEIDFELPPPELDRFADSSDDETIINSPPFSPITQRGESEPEDVVSDDETIIDPPDSDLEVANEPVQNTEPPPAVTPMYECRHPGCGKTYTKKNSLQNHEYRKHRERKHYRCRWPKCSYMSNYKVHVLSHVHAKHFKRARKYKGKPADASKYVQALPPGSVLIKPRKPKAPLRYRCSIEPTCGKMYRHRKSLLEHESSHRNEPKPYACTWPQCNFTSIRYGDTHRHIRFVHFGLKPSRKIAPKPVTTRKPCEFIRIVR